MSKINLVPIEPDKSRSYPKRIHIGERAQWQALSQKWDERVKQIGDEMASIAPGPQREAAERLHAQMRGARDQLADNAKRLAMEVGEFYAEDHHRVEEAVGALERLTRQWDQAKS